ncbi:MAG: DUF721 domain-containing protein [bacterium]
MAKRLAEIFKGLGYGAGQTIKLCEWLSLWSEVVDERVGRHTEAIKISNRTLYVSTTSSAWAQELTFLKKDIVEKFNERAGQEVIYDIRFRAGG